ncbi:MAG: hypothetical protein ACI8XG_001391 [Congregibacter sp.]|jgi:hypothetical protein
MSLLSLFIGIYRTPTNAALFASEAVEIAKEAAEIAKEAVEKN